MQLRRGGVMPGIKGGLSCAAMAKLGPVAILDIEVVYDVFLGVTVCSKRFGVISAPVVVV